MLTELHIENLGVIERSVLELGGGVTALTGETGAGKTMLVEAIELLVGGRADASMVRAGATEARIDGRFVLPDGDDDREVVLTRVVPADGRSRAYVDGRPVTVTHLAELTTGVADLHGQHAHQSLLSTATQREALDTYGQIDLGDLRASRARLTEIDAELATLGGDQRARAREIDLLRYQVDELDRAAISGPDEDVLLAREESTLADAVAHREAGAAALEKLAGEHGGSEAIRVALSALGQREPFAELADVLIGLSSELDDLVGRLRNLSESIEEDPQRLSEIRERRQDLHDLQRKYGDDLVEVMTFHGEIEARLRELEQYDRRAVELDRERSDAHTRERRAAAEIGRRRREVAPALAAAVEGQLRKLAMPNVSIEIEVGRDDDDDPGDEVRVMLSANPGTPLLPLTKVASGGELARAMLALRLVLTTSDGPGGAVTMVFDEVDAGIGGTAATAVAEALAALGDGHQVMVVTHLPQVAAIAERHLVVSKDVSGRRTFTDVAPVDGDRRVAEVARMLSGSETSAALEHARDLLTR